MLNACEVCGVIEKNQIAEALLKAQREQERAEAERKRVAETLEICERVLGEEAEKLFLKSTRNYVELPFQFKLSERDEKQFLRKLTLLGDWYDGGKTQFGNRIKRRQAVFGDELDFDIVKQFFAQYGYSVSFCDRFQLVTRKSSASPCLDSTIVYRLRIEISCPITN